jgi:hypothetical protein
VFGLLTDPLSFQFVFLNTEKKLFTSRLLQWHLEKAQIIRWIDHVLAESIKASPHTSPIKSRNRSLLATSNGETFSAAMLAQQEKTNILECDETDTEDETEDEDEESMKVLDCAKLKVTCVM